MGGAFLLKATHTHTKKTFWKRRHLRKGLKNVKERITWTQRDSISGNKIERIVLREGHTGLQRAIKDISASQLPVAGQNSSARKLKRRFLFRLIFNTEVSVSG